jgi:polyisoprenoid-binding protein YceI
MMEERHEFLAFSILYLLGLHVAAAFKHQVFDKDGVMRSILPEKKRHWMGAGAVVAVLAAGAVFYLVAPGVRPVAAERLVPEHPHDHEAGDDPAEAASHDHDAAADEDSAGGEENANAGVGNEVSHSADWSVDYGASTLKFVGTESGAQFEGAFSNYTAAITFDPEDLASAKIVVAVSTASARTGAELRDSSLPGSEWFDVKNHPTATFISTSVRKSDAGYEADGSLSIKNFKQPVTLEFTLDSDGQEAAAAGHANLIRTDFGLGEASSWLDEEGVALEVRVEFEIHASRVE